MRWVGIRGCKIEARVRWRRGGVEMSCGGGVEMSCGGGDWRNWIEVERRFSREYSEVMES
jgi:hypothetical protein